MPSKSLSLLICFLCLSTSIVDAQSQDDAASQTVDGVKFRVAEGLQFERVADESLIRWPVVADWDARGRLVVVESGGVGWPIVEHNQKRLHRIVRLEDRDGDGRFDHRIVAADQLPFTEGVLCLGDRMLVAAPPHILQLTDVDGDGVCEQRSVWFDGQTITNCANDLHGPYLGNDGWIYWCKGAFGEQTHDYTDGSTRTDRAAHLFRRRIEGGAIESVVAGGMDNPVEIAFTPSGDQFFTSTFLQHPANGKRDGIAHAIYGGTHGKDHGVLDGVTRTGPLMPIMTHLGPAAPSGLLCLHDESIVGGPLDDHESTLVSAQFNLHRIAAHRLRRTGASFQTDDQVLLDTDQIDFHPTDVIEDADGSLLVLDTGGWYDLCCPTSRVDQKVASGGIYRLRRKRAETQERVASHAETLGIRDARPWVRRESLSKLRGGGQDSVEALRQRLRKTDQGRERQSFLWALSFVGSEHALTAVTEWIDVHDPSLQLTAASIVSRHRFAAARSGLETLLLDSTSSPELKRVAMEALGRIGHSDSIDDLMALAEDCESQPILRHSLIFALIEIGDLEVLRRSLASRNEAEQTIALVALDQLKADIIPSTLTRLAQSSNSTLSETAIGVMATRSVSEKAARSLLVDMKDSAAKWELIRAWRERPVVHRYFAGRLSETPDDEPLLDRLSIWKGLDLPTPFSHPLLASIRKNPERAVPRVAAMGLRGESAKAITEAIQSLLAKETSSSLAKAWLAALPGGTTVRNVSLLETLIAERDYASLAKVKLDEASARRLLGMLNECELAKLPSLLSAVSGAGIDAVDEELLDALATHGPAKMLDENVLPNLYRNRDGSLRKRVEQLNAELHETPADIRTAVASKLASLPEGDAVRGLQLFRNSKIACSGCHRMGYIGGEIGPVLTKIGKTRTKEALLEAILFPSARIEQSYRSTQVLTVDGRVLSGLVAEETASTITLQLSADRTEVVAKTDIEERNASEVSIMPKGIDTQLTTQQLADLLELLQSAK